jgi:hypothetical protein
LVSLEKARTRRSKLVGLYCGLFEYRLIPVDYNRSKGVRQIMFLWHARGYLQVDGKGFQKTFLAQSATFFFFIRPLR